METQKRKIDWTTTLKKFATGAWGISTYLGLLLGAAWFAVATGGKDAAKTALSAVFLATWVNWMAFLTIERSSNNR
jgi:hypothetical protein